MYCERSEKSVCVFGKPERVWAVCVFRSRGLAVF